MSRSPGAVRLPYDPLRHTDRRPVTGGPSRAALDTLAKAATEAARSWTCCTRTRSTNWPWPSPTPNGRRGPAIQDELDRWTGGRPTEGTGIPDAAIPERPPQTNVPGRDFARPGTLPIGGEHDKTAVYAMLYGDTDDPAGWLRGGERCPRSGSPRWSWAWAYCRSVRRWRCRPRQALRRALSFFGWPYLAIRLGIPDYGHALPPRTPRLPAERASNRSRRRCARPRGQRSADGCRPAWLAARRRSDNGS